MYYCGNMIELELMYYLYFLSNFCFTCWFICIIIVSFYIYLFVDSLSYLLLRRIIVCIIDSFLSFFNCDILQYLFLHDYFWLYIFRLVVFTEGTIIEYVFYVPILYITGQRKYNDGQWLRKLFKIILILSHIH